MYKQIISLHQGNEKDKLAHVLDKVKDNEVCCSAVSLALTVFLARNVCKSTASFHSLNVYI